MDLSVARVGGRARRGPSPAATVSSSRAASRPRGYVGDVHRSFRRPSSLALGVRGDSEQPTTLSRVTPRSLLLSPSTLPTATLLARGQAREGAEGVSERKRESESARGTRSFLGREDWRHNDDGDDIGDYDDNVDNVNGDGEEQRDSDGDRAEEIVSRAVSPVRFLRRR